VYNICTHNTTTNLTDENLFIRILYAHSACAHTKRRQIITVGRAAAMGNYSCADPNPPFTRSCSSCTCMHGLWGIMNSDLCYVRFFLFFLSLSVVRHSFSPFHNLARSVRSNFNYVYTKSTFRPPPKIIGSVCTVI
jgi:hypothetical protein